MDLLETLKQAELADQYLSTTVSKITHATQTWPIQRGLVDVHPITQLIPKVHLQQYVASFHTQAIHRADALSQKVTNEVKALERDTTLVAKTLEQELEALKAILRTRAENEQSQTRERLDALSAKFEELEDSMARLNQEYIESSEAVEKHESQIEAVLTVPRSLNSTPQPSEDSQISANSRCCLTEDLLRARVTQITDLREDVEALERELDLVRDRHDGAKNLAERAREFKRRLELRQKDEEERRIKRFNLEERERREKIARLTELVEQAQQEDEIPEIKLVSRSSTRRLSSSLVSSAINSGTLAWSQLTPSRRRQSRPWEHPGQSGESFADVSAETPRISRKEAIRKRLQIQLEELRTQANLAETRVKSAEHTRSETLLALAELLADIIPNGSGTIASLERILKRLFGRTHVAILPTPTQNDLDTTTTGISTICERKCAAAAVKAETTTDGPNAFTNALNLLVQSDVLTIDGGTLRASSFED